MLLIGGFILLLVASLIAFPLFKKISKPLARFGAWTALFGLLTWPVLLGPLIFKLECSAFTKVDFGDGADARHTGFLDHRLAERALIETHLDQFILDRNVDDLVAGRAAFFEHVVPGSRPTVYLRYSLIDAAGNSCAPRVIGGRNGRSTLSQTAPGKCLGIERIEAPSSQFEVSMDGDFNRGIGVSKLLDRSTGKVVAALRTFGFDFLYSGTTVCPRLKVVGDEYSAHIAFTSLVFKDTSGKVRSVTARE
jgi:hypothetical protein